METKKYHRLQVVEAYQWHEVSPYVEGQPRDVDYFRDPNTPGNIVCPICLRLFHDHGWVNPHGPTVCPGDWILTDCDGIIEVWDDKFFCEQFALTPE